MPSSLSPPADPDAASLEDASAAVSSDDGSAAGSSGTPSSHAPRLRRWTVDEVEVMIDAGVFAPDESIELHSGHLLHMSPQSDLHFDVVTLVADALRAVTPDAMHLRTQGPLSLGDANRPEPDVMLVPGSVSAYQGGRGTLPKLVVEVAISSAAYDRGPKADIYATHGIETYWIVLPEMERVEVYSNPSSGVYETKDTYYRGDTLTPPGTSEPVAVSDFFPGDAAK